MKKICDFLKIFGLMLFVVLTGCFIAQKLGLIGDRPLRFPHKLHGKDQELECSSCHKSATTKDEAGMPTKKQCMLCHEGADEKKPPEKKAETLFKDGKPQWAHVTKLPEDVKFSHKVHADKNITCAQCHRGIESSDAITKDVRVNKDDCFNCHLQSKVAHVTSGAQDSNTCALCHKNITKETMPQNHEKNWKERHGHVCRGGDRDNSQNRCSLCHTESSCNNCHQDEAPKNHNNHWRHKGHGVAASIDRDNCSVCHKVDYCDRCHKDTAPRSHTGSWGSSKNNHCLTCHFPLKSENCYICHKGTPSHDSATPKPSSHTSGMNCRQCHGLGQPLPHVDKGDNCNGCHK